jgi:hypothetical protein
MYMTMMTMHLDVCSMLAPLIVGVLHSELEQQIIIYLEDLVWPLRDEISATKFVATRVATHLKHVELPSEDPSVVVSSSSAHVLPFGAL